MNKCGYKAALRQLLLNLLADDILRLLPHRYPFLLIDKILELEPGMRAVGQKNVSRNEPFFAGHFPEYPVMPGVLLLETIVQVGAAMMLSRPNEQGKTPCLTGISRARFRCPVVPGDVLIVSVMLKLLQEDRGWAHGQAQVSGNVVCEMDFSFCLT